MIDVPVAASAAFEPASSPAVVPELSNRLDYDDWLDYLYGRFMGCSLGGLPIELIPDGFQEFVDWRRHGEIFQNERVLP